MTNGSVFSFCWSDAEFFSSTVESVGVVLTRKCDGGFNYRGQHL